MSKLVDLCNYFTKFDFVCLSETWLKDEISFVLDLPGYVHFSFCRPITNRRTKRGAGGLLLYIKKELQEGVQVLPRGKEQDRMWIVLDKTAFGLERDTYVGFFYIPPVTSCNAIQTGLQWQTLELEIQQYKQMGDVVVMGDLNARIGLLNDNIVQDAIPNNVPCTLYCVSESLPRVSQDNTVNTYGKQLIDICINTGLQIVNGRVGADRGIGRYTCYTYNGSSVVDYVLAQTSIRERIVSFEVDNLQLHSDHCPILLKLNTGISYRNSLEETKKLSEVLLEEKLSQKEVECQNNEETSEIFWAGTWLKDQGEMFQKRLSEVDWRDRMAKLSDDLDTLPLEEGAECLASALTEVARDSGVLCLKIKGSAQNRSTSFPNNPWFDQDCKVAKRKVNMLLRRWKQLRDAESFSSYMVQKKLFKRLTKQKKRDHNSCLNASLRVLNRRDPKHFWRILELGKKTEKTLISDKISQGDWVRHFVGIHQETETNHESPSFLVNMVTQLDTDISTEEVHLAIDRMKDGKASGADGLCAELFKNLDEITLHTLTKLFNKVFQLGQFPTSWAQELIIPIYKGGEPDCANNYRGITLLPVIAKLFSAVLEKRIQTWATEEGIIPIYQFGFRKGHRTSDPIFVLNSLLEKTKWKRKRLFCCFIDFQKAFDSVSHGLLWKKLSNLGLSSRMCTILHSMYSQA